MKWYYETGGEQQGPVDTEQLQAMLAGGDLAADNKVWHKGMDAWTPAGEVAELSVDTDEAEEAQVSVMDEARAALAAAADSSEEPSSYDDDDDDDDDYNYDYGETDYSSSAEQGGGGGANPFGALAGGLGNLTGGGGGGGGGLLGGLGNLNPMAAANELRDKPIPKTAADVKHDFIDTQAKAKGTNPMLAQQALARLDALITAWKMSHTQEPDYAVMLSNFQEELESIKTAAADKSKQEWKAIGLAYAVIGVIVLIILVLV